jgi:hypothetical protein
MNQPQDNNLPALLKAPEMTATLEAVYDAIREQEESHRNSLNDQREIWKSKFNELEAELKQRTDSSGKPGASPEATIDEFREPFAKAMAEISVALWRIKQTTDKLEEGKETRRIQRDIANCIEALKTLGFETIDRANADLNTGIYRDVEVISNEMTDTVAHVTVSEVLKPAVHFRVMHALLRKERERSDNPPFIVQKCQVVTKSPPLPNA